MSLKRIVLFLGVALALAPLSALANSITFDFLGGDLGIFGGTSPITTQMYGGSPSPLTVAPIPFTTGSVEITTGSLVAGNASTGATYNPGGAVDIFVNGVDIFTASATFLATPITTWAEDTFPYYTLTGSISGTFTPAFEAAAGLSTNVANGTLTVEAQDPTFHAYGILNGSNIVFATGVPEPATLALLGFGLLGLAGVRRKLKLG